MKNKMSLKALSLKKENVKSLNLLHSLGGGISLGVQACVVPTRNPDVSACHPK